MTLRTFLDGGRRQSLRAVRQRGRSRQARAEQRLAQSDERVERQLVVPPSRNSLHFAGCPGLGVGVVCFSHPPNMRPISARGSERATYFLLSRSFTSQAIWRKNLRRYTLPVARNRSGA